MGNPCRNVEISKIQKRFWTKRKRVSYKLLDIITEKLRSDDTLSKRTPLSPENVRKLLEICLKTANFKFRDVFYELMEGVATGSPASSPVANLFMEHLEQGALDTTSVKPKIWKQFVDDTFAIIKKSQHDVLLQHLNGQNEKSSSLRKRKKTSVFHSWTRYLVATVAPYS